MAHVIGTLGPLNGAAVEVVVSLELEIFAIPFHGILVDVVGFSSAAHGVALPALLDRVVFKLHEI